MRFARLAKGVRARVVAAEQVANLGAARAVGGEPLGEAVAVHRLGGTEAAEAATSMGRAEVAAARLRHRAETRLAVRDHHAHGAAALALDALAPGRHVRLPLVEERRDHLDELALRDLIAIERNPNRERSQLYGSPLDVKPDGEAEDEDED